MTPANCASKENVLYPGLAMEPQTRLLSPIKVDLWVDITMSADARRKAITGTATMAAGVAATAALASGGASPAGPNRLKR